MNWLMLRGAWDERTEESIKRDNDMWLQLFVNMLGEKDTGRIWFRDAEMRKMEYRNVTVESSLEPEGDLADVDIVFGRGGFDYYTPIFEKCSKAKIIYYGAGRRHVPQISRVKYDLILVDSEEQKEEVKNVFERVPTSLFVKPAADCFRAIEAEKDYDLCFVANGQQADFKGVGWLYETIPDKYRCLHLGYESKYEPPQNVVLKRVRRHFMAYDYARCCMGVVPYWNKVDSCPRVIPEMLCCDMPIVVAEDLRFWREKYITENTGVIASELTFWDEVQRLLEERYKRPLGVAEYYQKHLSMDVAAKELREMICG